jgi:Na+/proline symporter
LISQRVLRTLLFSLAISTALFVVAAGSKTLFAAGGDDPTALVLHWISLSLFLALFANILLLVVALALKATDTPSHEADGDPSEAE